MDTTETPTEECAPSMNRTSARSKESTSSKEVLFPQNSCIFYSKGRRRSSGKQDTLAKCVTSCAEQRIKECAASKQDFVLLGKIAGVDLIAREALYHESCRALYIRSTVPPSTTTGLPNAPISKQNAYSNAFKFLCQYVKAASSLRRHIESARYNAPKMPWPPST